MNPDLDPWTKEFAEDFEKKPYYDRDDPLPVEPLHIYKEIPMTQLMIEDLEEFCKCGNRNEWIPMDVNQKINHAHYWGCTECGLKTPPLNKFDQLVEDLVDGKLNMNLVKIALASWVSRRKDLPETVRDMVSGDNPSHIGLIDRAFKIIKDGMGELELAYRRGVAHGGLGQDDQDAGQ